MTDVTMDPRTEPTGEYWRLPPPARQRVAAWDEVEARLVDRARINGLDLVGPHCGGEQWGAFRPRRESAISVWGQTRRFASRSPFGPPSATIRLSHRSNRVPTGRIALLTQRT